MIPVSVIVITKNEEHNIDECLQSVSWAEEIVVVDTGSTDSTVERARNYTEKVFTHEWRGYGEAKNFALQQCNNEWVFWLDADERVTAELQEEVRHALASVGETVVAFRMPRLANFLGRWIYHGGWYPGKVVRLFRKSFVTFSDARVHEQLVLSKGEIADIKAHLLHYTDPTLEHYLQKFNTYTTLAAEELRLRGKKFHLHTLLVNPIWVFLKMYIVKAGFRDGIQGFLLSVLSAHYVFVKYAKHWERTTKGGTVR